MPADQMENPVDKVHVTIKSVEAANRLMQHDRGVDRKEPSGGGWVSVSVKPVPPSPLAIARAGERALQSIKKQAA